MAQAEQRLPDDFFVDLDRSSPLPLYFQMATRLERSIREEDLTTGSRLENEISIGQRFGLSRPTVRRAIQELVDKGLLVRHRGIGTQVVHGQVTRGLELTSLYEDLSQTGQVPTTTVIIHEVIAADENMAHRLGIMPGSAVLHLVRLRRADGVPIAVLENTITGEFADLAREAFEERGLYQLLRIRGVAIRVAKQQIGARDATGVESTLLSLPKKSAVLSMSRTAFDSSGRAVEFGDHCYAPDRYSFEMTLVEN